MINLYEDILAHPDYFAQISVNDLLFVHYKCPQKEDLIHLFTHHNYLIYSLSGSRRMLRNQDGWMLTKDVSLFVKKSAFTQEWYRQEDWEVIVFFIPDIYLRKILNEYRNHLPLSSFSAESRGTAITVDINETGKAFFYSMLPYFTQSPAPPSSLLEIKFRELFFNILSNPANASLVSYINELGQHSKPSLSEIMESNYMYNLSLSEFAKLSHRSLATFKRDFIKIYQIPPGKWLMQKRIDHARLLLTTTKSSINSIAFDSGFESGAHFSRVFRERFGLSPLRSRKEAWDQAKVFQR